MKNLLLFVALCFLVNTSAKAEVAIVVHPENNSEITAELISQLFLGKAKRFANGSGAIPIGQDESSPATAAFNERIIKRTARQVKAYWSKQVFSGKGAPPKSVMSDEEVLELIANNPNSIGYVDRSKVNDKVKIVLSL